MIHGHLRLGVLHALAKEPHTGYDLMKLIGSELGTKPSPGSIYPLMRQLYQQGLVSIKVLGKQKEYTLTSQGKNALDKFLENKDLILNSLRSSMKWYEAVAGSNVASDTIVMLERMRSGKAPFGPLSSEMVTLRNLALRATEKELSQKQVDDLIRILKKTNDALRTCIA